MTQTIQKGFKETEVGAIPEDWELQTLAEVCRFENGDRSSNYPSANEFVSYGIPFINAGHVFDGIIKMERMDYIPDFVFNRLGSGKILPGDILFCLRGSLGKFGVVRSKFGKGAIASSLVIIRPKFGTTEKYLSCYFKSELCRRMIELYAGGAAQPNLGAKELEKFIIPLPPTKAEQTAIATALGDMDELISSLGTLIEKKKAIKQGAMQQLLSPKEDWVVKKLGELAEIVGGGTPSSFIAEYWNGNINWFTPTEVGGTKYLSESQRKITKEGFANSSTRMLPKGTVLLTSRAGIGDLGILENEACTNQGFQSLIANKDVDNEFLYYLMSTLKKELLENASGSTFLEISPSKLKQIEVCVPEKEEQTEIATILSDMDREIAALEQNLSKYQLLKQGMTQELLTGRIRIINC